MGDYIPPTPAELRALLRRWGRNGRALTGREAGALCHVHPRTVRKWVAAKPPIPFPALYVLAHQREGKTLEPDTWRSHYPNLVIAAGLEGSGPLEPDAAVRASIRRLEGRQ